jgi:Holliday junction resolvasome RuvABC endonuclease subunit
MALVLGIDSGFASCGYSRVELSLEKEDVLACGVIRTQKSATKRDYKASDDNTRRAREIVQALLPVSEGIVAICSESPSLPRNASTSFKLGICYGILATLAEIRNVPVVMVSPQELKKRLCGTSKASKADVAEAIDQRFGRDFGAELLQRGVPSGEHEHPYDSIGAVISSLDSEVIQMARRLP